MEATQLAPATLPLAGRTRWDPAEETPPLPAGTVIDGRYRVIGLLGEGGMGRVYEAQHLFIGRKLALKLVRRDAGTGEGATRVIQEALVAGKVPHATVVPVYDCAALPDGQVYVAMELLRGESLEQALRRPLPAGELLRWLAEVARGLAAAHRAGIVHRDVKPANLFLAVDAGGRVQPRILDFGIAKLLPGLAGEAAAVQTQAGALLGTPYYMAPERGRGEAGGPASDLYSLGVILYEALTGELPFVGDNFMEVVGRHLREAPLDPRQAAPERPIPDALAQLVLALLAKDGRPDDGEAVARALVEIAGSGEIAALVAGPRGAEGGAAAAEAATQSLVAAATRRLVEDGLADRSTWRIEDGPQDMSQGSGGSGSFGHVPGDSVSRSGARDVPGDSAPRGHVLGDMSQGGPTTRRTVALALAFVAAAGLGGWTAWRWAEAQEAAPPAPRVEPAGPGDGSQPGAQRREPIAAGGSTGEIAEPAADTTGRAADAGSTGGADSPATRPALAGGTGGPDGPAKAPAPAGKKRPAGTGGKKAGTTGAGKDDRPKLKTDVYDD